TQHLMRNIGYYRTVEKVHRTRKRPANMNSSPSKVWSETYYNVGPKGSIPTPKGDDDDNDGKGDDDDVGDPGDPGKSAGNMRALGAQSATAPGEDSDAQSSSSGGYDPKTPSTRGRGRGRLPGSQTTRSTSRGGKGRGTSAEGTDDAPARGGSAGRQGVQGPGRSASSKRKARVSTTTEEEASEEEVIAAPSRSRSARAEARASKAAEQEEPEEKVAKTPKSRKPDMEKRKKGEDDEDGDGRRGLTGRMAAAV
ncbi:hypothetical protein LTS18_002893, partial [Coniosporium uncinatum]